MSAAPCDVRRAFVHTAVSEDKQDQEAAAEGACEPRSRAQSDSAVDYGASDASTAAAGDEPRSPESAPAGLSSTSPTSDSSSSSSSSAAAASAPGALPEAAAGGQELDASSQVQFVGLAGQPMLQLSVSSFYVAVPVMQWGVMPMMPQLAGQPATVQGLSLPPAAALTPEQLMQLSPEELERAAWELQEAARQTKEHAQRSRQADRLRGPGARHDASSMSHFPSDRHSFNAGRRGPCGPPEKTTVMIRNLPNDYSRDMLLLLLDEEGFAGCYDFVYYPIDFRRWAGFGYAFVNMVSAAEAHRIQHVLQGFCDWELPSQKVVEVCWGDPLQGLDACVERYRNSPVMHRSVPDFFKPATFEGGRRVPFPSPTKRIRDPRFRGPGFGDEQLPHWEQ